MLTLTQARALELEAELGEEELLFFDGLPLTAPSPVVAPLPPIVPAATTAKKSLGQIAIPDHLGVDHSRQLLQQMEQAETISDLFALQKKHPFYRREARGTPLLLGTGPIPAKLMVVAGRFQKEDFQSSIAFSGQVGTALEQLFKECGMQFQLSWRTALFKGEWSQRFLPREKQLLRDFLSLEIGLIRPSHLIVLGEPALEILMGRPTTLADARWRQFASLPLTAIAHPLQWNSAPEMRADAVEALQQIVQSFRSAPKGDE